MTKHSEATTVHRPYTWEYDDAADREAATGFAAADVGKLARQLDDNSLWMLIDDSSPDWVAVGGAPYIPTMYHVPLFTPDANTAFATIGSPDTQGHAYYSTGTLNNEATWNINLPSGTYKIVVRHSKANNRGVYHVYFDGVDEGNFDGYNASPTFVINTITGLAWAGGVVAIKIKMESKNGSSTDYFGVLYDIYLVRTGD
jgi:hypothetical protein